MPPKARFRAILRAAAARIGQSERGRRRKALASRRLTEQEEEDIRRELAQLRQEHRDLDLAIAAMIESSRLMDTIRVQRLKKRKLFLKDRIASLEDQLLPDIIA
jgi:hypothetical protein